MKAAQRSSVRLMPRTKHVHNYSVIVSVRGKRIRWGCDGCAAVDWNWYSMTDPWGDVLRGVPATQQVQDQATARAVRALSSMGLSLDEYNAAKAPGKAAGGLKTSGWLSGSEGDRTDPQGPNAGVGFIVKDEHRDDSGTRVLDKVELIDYGPRTHGFGEIVDVGDDFASRLDDTYCYDPDHMERARSDNDFGIQKDPEGNVHLDPDHPHADTPDVPDYTREQLQGMKVKDQLLPLAKDLGIKRRFVLSKDELVDKILEAQDQKD